METVTDRNVQYSFLTKAKEQQTPMIIYMMNGFQVRGIIIDYDRTSILIDSDGTEKLLYKNAISTIAPVTGQDFGTSGKGYNTY